MEESKKISLGIGNVSWEQNLGMYYIDMRPAIVHYTHNIWGGDFDEAGVPRCMSNQGLIYFPINIAQYGFILHAQYLENPSDELFKKLNALIFALNKQKYEDEHQAVWFHHHVEEKYKIKPPWPSAMAQGEIISFFLRMYQLNYDEQLLKTAQKAYQNLVLETHHGGTRYIDSHGYVWLEEYPSNPPSLVLNGFIYALFGIIDLYRVTRHEIYLQDVQQCIKTIQNHLHLYDAGYWSYYDLYKKELVRYYYQKNVHVLQLKVLYQLFQLKEFDFFAQKWEKNINPWNYLLVQLMYRINPRIKKMKQWIS
jgi:hypothetical protein